MSPRRYCPPASTAAWSGVNRPTSASARSCTATTVTAPNPQARPMAQNRVCFARSGFPAPRFCAPSAETADSIDDGTRNRKPMIFSTIPTAVIGRRSSSSPTVSTSESDRNSVTVFPVAAAACGRSSAPMARAIETVVPIASPTIMTVSICMTCEPTATAVVPATPSYRPMMNRSAIP